ncbi:MAG: tryptophan synthase subunit alpha [Gemmatimonadota bacterium]
MSGPGAGGASGAERIEQAIRRRNEAGEPALAAFLTAGFPDLDSFGDTLLRVAAEADLVELGVPFSDPMADGVTIQRSSQAALRAGVDLPWILAAAASASHAAPVLLMSYLNPLLAFGVERLAAEAAGAGVAGLIIPDLPLEECEPLRAAFEQEGMALVQLVTPLTPPQRLRRVCEASAGFVYAVTITGTTGGADFPAASLADYLGRVCEATTLPVLAGFGIRTAQHLSHVSAHADGAIVGSALIELLEQGADPVSFLRGLRPAAASRPSLSSTSSLGVQT